MRKKYRPRRANKKWMQDAPKYVLSVHDDPTFSDRYTIYFVPEPESYSCLADCRILYLGCNECPAHPAMGISIFGEVEAINRQTNKRIKWLDLPENIRKHVISRYTR